MSQDSTIVKVSLEELTAVATHDPEQEVVICEIYRGKERIAKYLSSRMFEQYPAPNSDFEVGLSKTLRGYL